MTAPRTAAATPTDFQARVYAALCAIPPGRVTTYGRLARALGCGSPRAVGQALRRNPFAPAVPCHRVIAADLTLGGFNGSRGEAAVARKRARLHAEGVAFDDAGRLLDRARLWTASNLNEGLSRCRGASMLSGHGRQVLSDLRRRRLPGGAGGPEARRAAGAGG
jgi:methylated-DNA-[protein]-cysteine S-methyltransferase